MAEQNKFDKIRAEIKAQQKKKAEADARISQNLDDVFNQQPNGNLTDQFYRRQNDDQNSSNNR